MTTLISPGATDISLGSEAQLCVISFGFGHGPAPASDLTIDLRDWFRDPHVSPALRMMTGRDYDVVINVLSTRGMASYIERLFEVTRVLVELDRETVILAVGCVGGRHRSVVVADHLACYGRSSGWSVDVIHRDIHRPVLTGTRKPAAADRH